ncbi:uncharacterized protein FOMMEDRAFT_145452 [Fomitiporia mediterranea MF3/22]|uniref:uncharacterized protein n=1 Tax=Fomitiporia mediterranea (strain MF3/22) TaxID=694068 RepID=UPI0004408920|nr:uncharacterized protein FOMMEDRAFT_145452 [Fomitiporia mediterranea MF3/22]EJD06199.1 hypothetical protein FOMMEDRAFT_145452 [Fomitiporia mediterranea MF3/22]
MQATHSGSSSGQSSSTLRMHGRSHSLSDPRAFLVEARDSSSVPPPLSATSSPSFDFYQTPPTSDWQSCFGSTPQSTHPSPTPNVEVTSDVYAPLPHAAPRAASPQSMVSSGSTHVESVATSSPHAAGTTSPSRSSGKKPSIDRNRKPCGACSSSKRKCKVIPDVPNLCERCRSHGLIECPPHISWSNRKASIRDNESLSPLETDDKDFSSRSVSPSYYGSGKSPVGYSGAYNQDEGGLYPDMATTREWVQNQTLVASGSSNTVDMVGQDPFYAQQQRNENQNQFPTHNQNLTVPHFVQQYAQNNPCLVPPVLPACHNCHTPYDEYLVLNYALATLSANLPCPPYEVDQRVLNAYENIPHSNSPYENQNSF